MVKAFCDEVAIGGVGFLAQAKHNGTTIAATFFLTATTADPRGRVTHPASADTDGDGTSDGVELLQILSVKSDKISVISGKIGRYHYPLTSVGKALGMAQGMTYKGIHPTAVLIEQAYLKGVRLDKKTMKPYEKCLDGFTEFFSQKSTFSCAVSGLASNDTQ